MIPIRNLMVEDISPRKIFVNHDELAAAVNGLSADHVLYFKYESEMIRVTYLDTSIMKGRVGLCISDFENDKLDDMLIPEISSSTMLMYSGPVHFLLKLPTTLEKCLEAAAGLVVENVHSA